MQLDEKEHKKIMKQGKELFEMFETYDKTRVWPLGRKRLNITLSKKTIEKLKKLRNKTKKPISKIIEESVLSI